MYAPEIKTTDPMTVAYKRMRGMYSQTPQGLGELYMWVARQGLHPGGMPQAIYLTSPDMTPEPESQWELWAPLADPVPLRDEDEFGIGIKLVPATKVASLMYKGPYEEIGPAYQELGEWVEARGHHLVGPPRELYYSDPAKVAPEDYLTEVQMPIG